MLVNSVFIAEIDEAMAHFQVRSAYSQRMGAKLAQTFDNHVMREIALAAQAAATITGEDGGLVIDGANLAHATAATKFTAWEDMLFAAAENFDNKFVEGQRWCILKPADYYFLVRYVATNGFSAIHNDYKGAGSYADGSIIAIAGIPFVPSPMLPTADYAAEDFHKINMENTKALIFTAGAVATVKLLDLSLRADYDPRRLGTLMVAKYAMGHGILQPECSILARTADPDL